jgi:DNA polymerase-1
MSVPLYLVDGYSIIYRSYFAFLRNPLRSPDGRNTSAVFGFFRFLFQLNRIKGRGRVIVTLDPKTPTFRHKLYPEYKANRESAPPDLHDQVPVIEDLLRLLGVPCISCDGFEADDVIATLADICRKEETPCYVLSGDKDLLQLVGGPVKILHPEKGAGGFSEWGRDDVYANRGIYPEQVKDYLALTGDSSDNVPGVAGVGDKTAIKLLEQFGDLDNIYEGLGEIKSESQRKKLEAGRESAYLSRNLIELRRDAPLDETKLEPAEPQIDKAIEVFHREGIRSFDGELGMEAGEERLGDRGELKRIEPGQYACILDENELDKWIDKARSAGVFAFDCETDNIDEMLAEPLGLSLSTGKGEACYVPIKAQKIPAGKRCIEESTIKEKMAGLLTDPKVRIVGQNIKYDYKVFKRWGIEIENIYFDTMIAAWILDTTRSSYSMDRLARDLLSYETIHYQDLIEKKSDLTLADVELERVTDYAAEDADITFQLYELLHEDLERNKLDRVFFDLEMPNVKVLAEMELTGIRVLPQEMASLSLKFEKELAEVEKEIFREVGREFNISSTKQLQEILFVERKLKPIKKTKTGWSTDSQVLEILAAEDPVCANILKHRNASKLKSTYVDALPQLINPHTGRLHTHYNQTGSATGRLASQDPNLQNIPIREASGRQIRDAFVASPGYIFVSADYSQIELVVLAELSQDPILMEAFRSGKDIHNQTAALLFGVEQDQVTTEMRRIGKTINFGVIYGMSAFRMSRDLKIPRKDAETFIQTYFQRYSGVDAFIKRTIKEAEESGYVQTMDRRRRYLPRINSRNKTEKRAEERIAVNTPIQGSAADIIKRAMIQISEKLQGLKSRLILQIHDELLFEVADEELEKAKELVKHTMETAMPMKLPLRVQLDEGSSWGSLH